MKMLRNFAIGLLVVIAAVQFTPYGIIHSVKFGNHRTLDQQLEDHFSRGNDERPEDFILRKSHDFQKQGMQKMAGESDEAYVSRMLSIIDMAKSGL